MNYIIQDSRSRNRFDISICSGIGKREAQQDFAYCSASDDEIYAVVCDGMGGMKGGELASRRAAEVAANCFERHCNPQKNSSKTGHIEDWMSDAILEADRQVYLLQDSAGGRLGAGSTLVSVWIREKQLYWSSVGDSRLYLFRGNEAVQATTDLNYFYILNERKSIGQISDSEYKRESSNGEALVSFCGLGNVDLIDRNTNPLLVEKGDIILLCSDGFYRTIDQQWMLDILDATDTMEEVSNYIHAIISEHGTDMQDNYTCILIKVVE
jgi:protein phosphatase